MEREDLVNENIRLTQNTAGLCYGTDALLLSAFITGKCSGSAVELGAGTGIISILCAKRVKFARITAVEVQDEYASLCERNARENGMDDRIRTIHADLRKVSVSDIGAPADCVFANPPYMLTTSGPRNENDGKYAARHEVFGGIADFCECAARLLRHGGSACFVWRPDRLADIVCAMRDKGIEPKYLTVVYDDENHKPCLLLVEGRKGGKSGLSCTPPLFIRSGGRDSEQIKYIYENGEMPDGYRKK